MYRRVKKDAKDIPEQKAKKSSAEPQILTRSRVREHNKNKKRNSWLNRAIIIVVLLLVITIYAVLKW